MANPFPGMDPYVERNVEWSDFHAQFVIDLRRALVPLVGRRYRPRGETLLFIHEPPAESRRGFGRADSAVTLTGAAATNAPSPGATAGRIVAPELMPLDVMDVVEERHHYVTVRDGERDEVVTVLEVLSPTNKRGEGRGKYFEKRVDLLRAGVHFIEIDLLRGGPRLAPVESRPTAYRVTLTRGERTDVAEVWPVGLRDPLPTIPVPLRAPDPDIALDLQAVLDRTFEGAGYLDDDLYRRPPDDPPLAPDDLAWAEARIREALT